MVSGNVTCTGTSDMVFKRRDDTYRVLPFTGINYHNKRLFLFFQFGLCVIRVVSVEIIWDLCQMPHFIHTGTKSHRYLANTGMIRHMRFQFLYPSELTNRYDNFYVILYMIPHKDMPHLGELCNPVLSLFLIYISHQ